MRKNVLLLIPTLEVGGAERQAIAFARYLLKREYVVRIIGTVSDGSLLSNDSYGDLKFDVFPSENNVLIGYIRKVINKIYKIFAGKSLNYDYMAYDLATYIKNQAIDSVVSYCSVPNVIAGFAKKYAKKEFTCIWYQRDAGIYNLDANIERRALELVDFVLANSSSGMNYLKDLTEKSVEIIANGYEEVIVDDSRKHWRDNLCIGDEIIILTMVANISQHKDHMSFLQAISELKRRGIDAKKIRVILAGRFGDTYEQCKQYVIDNELVEIVKFVGPIDDVEVLLSETDIFVLSTFSEGCSNAIVEAMFAGLPIVATKILEIEEIIGVNNENLLIERNNFRDMADTIQKLIHNEKHRIEVGLNNHGIAISKFSEKDNFMQLECFIEKEKR